MRSASLKSHELRPISRRVKNMLYLRDRTKPASKLSASVKSSRDGAPQERSTNDESNPCTAAATPVDLCSSHEPSISSAASPNSPASSPHNHTDIFVAGSLAIDLSCDYRPPKSSTSQIAPQQYTSNPATITQTIGGVGHNVASAMHHLGASVRLCSLVGDDLPGSVAISRLKERGIQTSGVLKRRGCSTAQYVAVNNSKKNLLLAMADMEIMEHRPYLGRLKANRARKSYFTRWQAHIDTCKPKWIVVDGNWDPVAIRKWIRAGKRLKGTTTAFEPVSAVKSKRLFAYRSPPRFQELVDLATPNLIELTSMYAAADEYGWFGPGWRRRIDAMGEFKIPLKEGGVSHQAIQLLPFIPTILTKMGGLGVLMTRLLRSGDDRLTSPESAPYILSRSAKNDFKVGGVYMRLFPAVEKVPENEIISVNGVGDTFLGVLVVGLARENPKKAEDLIDIAQRGSVMTLKSKESVSPQISTLRIEL